MMNKNNEYIENKIIKEYGSVAKEILNVFDECEKKVEKNKNDK